MTINIKLEHSLIEKRQRRKTQVKSLIYRIEVDEDGEPRVHCATGIVERCNPDQTQQCRHNGTVILSVPPITVDEVPLKDPDRDNEGEVGGDGIETCLEIGEFDDLVLEIDCGIIDEVGQRLNPHYEEEKVESSQILQGLPDTGQEMIESVRRDVRCIDFL